MVNFEKYVDVLWDLIENLEKKTIYDSFSNCGPSGSKDSILKLANKTNIDIPDIIKKILAEYGVLFRWKIINPNKKNRLITAHSIYRGTEYFYHGGFQNRYAFKENDEYNPPFYPIDATKEEIEKWKQYYILDDLYLGKLVLLKPDENGENHELYLFDHPNTIAKLTISIEQYFEITNKTLGMYCWQEYVTEKNYMLDGAIPDNFHENMAILFPEVDLSIFRTAPELEDSIFNRYVAKADKVDYRAKFIKKMEELQANPNVEFRYYEEEVGFKRDKLPYTANYGVPEAVLRKIKKDYGREIPESMLSFYYQMNGCKLNWKFKNDNANDDFWLVGNINFLELEEVMGGKWNDLYLEWNSPDLFKDEGSVYHLNEEEAEIDPEIAAFMKHARLFDLQGDMCDYFIDFAKGQEEPGIYKVVRTEYYKMNIDFITFIEARIEFAGISGWEHKFIDSEDYHDEEFKAKLLNEFKEKVIKVLPNANFTKFGL